MRYTPQILLCFTVWIASGLLASCLAKDSPDPESLKKAAKDVETVLSPTLVDELQGAQSNRSAVNVEQTASPRNREQTGNENDRKPDIQFDNQIFPYHYERSYHYQYPPNPHDEPPRPIGYTERFYDPGFRPKTRIGENRLPAGYYRSDLYNPFTPSTDDRNPNSNLQSSSSTNGNSAIDGDEKKKDNSGASEVSKEAVTPTSYPRPALPASHPLPYPFPSVDFGNYRHGAFGRPLVTASYFRPGADVATPPLPKDPPGYYLPQPEVSFADSPSQRSVETFNPLPPLEPFHNYPSKEFQGYNEPRPPQLTDTNLRRTEQLPPPFFGSFFPSGYQSPFYPGRHPSDPYSNLFSDNFTRNFPSRPSFGGFYSHHNYLPPPPPPSAPTLPPAGAEAKPEEPLPPGGPSSQPIPTTKPGDNAAPMAAAASNTFYERKLFYPAKNKGSAEEFAFVSEKFQF